MTNEDLPIHEMSARVVGRTMLRHDRRIVLEDAKLHGEDFSGRKLDQFCAIGSRFEFCRFDRMRAENSSFGAGRKTSLYLDCTFDGAKLFLGPGGFTRFERCSFRHVDLRDWWCFSVELIDCTFTGKLRHSWFNGTPLEEDQRYVRRKKNEFRGNDFSGAELLDVGFRTGIDLTKQRLPSGPDYLYIPDAEKTLRSAREEAIGWQDLDLRRFVLRFIDSDLEDVAAGQMQLLLRPKDYCGFGGLKRDELDALFDLLRRHNTEKGITP